ncbi:hypothetical protein L1987_85982 [Smallanthus sonchifolius]|uniref:Uncharacterized protein n=1 Tax=Smallanthus sonchifolius TaxID=185202 RepID=A0ACB8XYQ0_9ASTR|nr:hypothetical protein L1987_85982 [Smallanthus sonchifolius]
MDHLPSPSGDSPAGAANSPAPTPPLSRYESQKRRDWNTFLQYLKNHKPPLTLSRCSGAHVIEFLKYLDQFGKTKKKRKRGGSSKTATVAGTSVVVDDGGGGGGEDGDGDGNCDGGTSGVISKDMSFWSWSTP